MMVTWFYVIVCILHIEQAFLSTIHQAKFHMLDLNEHTGLAIRDIGGKIFFKALCALVSAVFPALHWCGLNTHTMDTIFYLSHHTTMAIKNLIEPLNDFDLFGAFGDEEKALNAKASEIFGEEDDDRYAKPTGSVQFDICNL